MAFFTRRGNSNVPEIPSSSNNTHHKESKDEELMKQINYRTNQMHVNAAQKTAYELDREGVEV